MTHTTYKSTKSMLIVGSIAALGILALANPAAAWYGYDRGSDINVSSENGAIIINDATVTANTGYNAALGGNTGAGGEGGEAAGNRATGGDGGNSGSAGDGGDIRTGNATAIGTISNDVNRNETDVTADCGCRGDINVWSGNQAMLANGLGVAANTGDNAVVGGTSGAAGDGGDAWSHSWMMWDYYMNMGGATGGNGGNSGSAGDGGSVMTGNALSDGMVINVVNRNVTRVAR